MSKRKRIGPIGYYWGKNKSFLDVYLTDFADCPLGWQWGSDGHDSKPIIAIRLFGLDILWWEKRFISILGFWWMK